MNPRLRILVAALAASAAATAFAQTAPQPGTAQSATAAAALDKPLPTLSEQPIASAARNGGDDVATVETIVREIAADPAFRQSKITVQTTENGILLTGVTRTHAQMEQAVRIATQHAGEGEVANALTTEEQIVAQGGGGRSASGAAG